MTYKITFLDYWHISSGLSAGAKADSIVLKDKDNLPFIGGKTLKGLIKEQSKNKNFLDNCFGRENNQIGRCYFSNATLNSITKQDIIKGCYQNRLYDEISSTKIDKHGIAETGSLRNIEVVIPLSLYASIENIPNEYAQEMQDSIKKIKRMGLNRNRGLGRCIIEIVGEVS